MSVRRRIFFDLRPGVWIERALPAVLCLLLGVACSSESVHGDLLDEIRERGVLRWGADEEGGGPFVYRRPGTRDLIGFEAELAELIAKAVGVRAEFVQCQWDKLPATLDLGEIDIVLNGYEWTPIRARHYGTSIPYYIYELQLLGRRSDSQLQSLPDLLDAGAQEPVVVSALTGSAAEAWILNYGGDRVRVAGFDGVTDAMKAVELGQDGIRANMQDLPIWTFYERDFPALRAVDRPVGRGFYVALTRRECRNCCNWSIAYSCPGFRTEHCEGFSKRSGCGTKHKCSEGSKSKTEVILQA